MFFSISGISSQFLKPKSRLFHYLALISILAAILFYGIYYIVSPYWFSHTLVRQLQQNDIVVIKQMISPELIQPYRLQPQLIVQVQPSSPKAGDHYLKQVWPIISQQQDIYQMLLLQFNSAPTDSIEHHYSNFPSTFRMTLGKPDNVLWFEWQRQSWTSWQLSQICFYNPQPIVEAKRCESSSR